MTMRRVTVVDCLALSVCGLLAASLLLPLVARTRQSARSAGCTNNLRQIGLAFHNYHSAYKVLPQGTGGSTGPSAPEKNNAERLGPLVALTPFVEQQALWEIIANPYRNPETGEMFPPMGPVPWYPAEKYGPWGMSPDVFHCPDNNGPPQPTSQPKKRYTLVPEINQSTTTSYVACYGDGTFLQAEQKLKNNETMRRRRAANRGMFVPVTPIKFRDILDGLSNTVMFSEVVASRPRKPGVSEIARDINGISKNPSLCLATKGASDLQFWPFGRGALWADGFLPIGGFQTVLPPNSPSCTSELGIEDSIVSASSNHAGGVHVLMADGAIKFATDTIDTGDLTQPGVADQPGYNAPGSRSPYGIWGALGSRASAEVINTAVLEPAVARRTSTSTRRDLSGMSRWRGKDGKASLQAEFVQIIDKKTIQLRAPDGTIHEVPLNTLSDRDIYRAVQMDLVKQKK